jgi:hypothetical protein
LERVLNGPSTVLAQHTALLEFEPQREHLRFDRSWGPIGSGVPLLATISPVHPIEALPAGAGQPLLHRADGHVPLPGDRPLA